VGRPGTSAPSTSSDWRPQRGPIEPLLEGCGGRLPLVGRFGPSGAGPGPGGERRENGPVAGAWLSLATPEWVALQTQLALVTAALGHRSAWSAHRSSPSISSSGKVTGFLRSSALFWGPCWACPLATSLLIFPAAPGLLPGARGLSVPAFQQAWPGRRQALAAGSGFQLSPAGRG